MTMMSARRWVGEEAAGLSISEKLRGKLFVWKFWGIPKNGEDIMWDDPRTHSFLHNVSIKLSSWSSQELQARRWVWSSRGSISLQQRSLPQHDQGGRLPVQYHRFRYIRNWIFCGMLDDKHALIILDCCYFNNDAEVLKYALLCDKHHQSSAARRSMIKAKLEDSSLRI